MMILRKLSHYLFFLCFICSFISVVICGRHFEKSPSPKIAIFHSFSHPLLIDCSQSCVEALSALGNIPEIITVNAEDNLIKARKLARSLHTDKNIVAIITLGVLATKVMSTIETKKPVIYAAVPNEESLVIPKTQENIQGISDNLDINQYCFAIQAVTTNAESVVYLKPSDPFPSNLQNEMIKKLHASGIEVIEIPITQSTLKTRVRQALDKRPSAIFIPLSSLMRKEGLTFIQDILKEKIPIVTDDLSLIPEGACIACGVDYKKSGKLVAQLTHHMLYNIQDHEALRKIIAEPLAKMTTFNEDIIKKLGIKMNKTEKKQFRSIIFKDKKTTKSEEPNISAA